jgi:hypothetical protein
MLLLPLVCDLHRQFLHNVDQGLQWLDRLLHAGEALGHVVDGSRCFLPRAQAGDMVGEPRQSDTRLSRTEDSMELVGTMR